MPHKPTYEELEQRIRQLEKALSDSCKDNDIPVDNPKLATGITECKRAEEALRQNEKLYQSLFNNAQVALFKTSVDGKLIEINKRYANLAGYSGIEECMKEFEPGKAWVYPENRAKLIERLLEKGTVNDFEAEIIRKDGSRIWILFSARILPESGVIEGSIVDISYRKQVEETLKNNEAIQQKMIANIGDVIVIIDKDGNNRYKSPNIEKLFGWKPEDVVGASTWDNIHPDDMPSSQAFFIKLIKTPPNNPGTIECRYRCKDGRYRWIEFTGNNLMDDPDIQGILGNYHDITERKQAEQSLRESETRFKALHNASFGGIAIHDKGMILECNKGLSDITGYSVEELIGMDGLMLIAEKSRDHVMGNILSGYEKPYEALGVRKNGEEYPLRLEARNVPYKGKMVRTVEFRDITESKQAEQERIKLQEQLNQAQKMESVGRLAGGVAHDFNNMLGVILGYSELALENVEEDSPLHTDLQEIHFAATRSMEITKQLLAFARQQTVAPRILDLNVTIQSMLKMIQRLIGEDIQLVLQPDPELWTVSMDPTQIDQILANLCVNARDAIRDVGKIIITTRNISIGDLNSDDHAGVPPGEYVLLNFIDDGCGMTQDVLDNLFEPFYTTKNVHEGTGLGLATVYGIIKQNQGFITVKSEIEKGTTFNIYLPHAQSTDTEVEAQTEKAIQAPNARNNETVLLVEDEPGILFMTKTMLQKLGYTVLVAGSPGSAINMAIRHEGEINLLITDVIMPEMNGRDLADKLTDLYPHLKCLFMSGYTADVIGNHGVLDQDLQFIQKPFTKQDLAVKVHEVLDHPNP